MVTLPTITLDTTFAELYRKASPRNAHKKIGQVLCGTNSGMSLSDDFPRNVKYLYQDTPFNSLSKKELTDQNRELQRSLAMESDLASLKGRMPRLAHRQPKADTSLVLQRFLEQSTEYTESTIGEMDLSYQQDMPGTMFL